MTFERIPFINVQNLIEEIFENKTGITDFNLTPNSIHKFAESSGIQLKWRPIVNWRENFEKHSYKYSEEEFLAIAFAKVKPINGKTIIVTDECFKDKMAFSIFEFKHIIHFMEVIYPNLFNMEFIEPSDYIFLQPEIQLITMIHHEGARTKYFKT